ncbi:uncharacterized protein LOC116345339 [Contarinia nasturtii]|uniref:uncharacterized protein LOC116345339 n=1 Tax=Contarinia nasturtii TaxID=265458 RepID=UPI0012D4B1A4|nr:uncharacterized protein LOC116345339 [Contarinia nasturtii]
MSNKSTFAIGELVLCQYGEAWYEARILQIIDNKNTNYLVHYIGSHVRYDEWVTEDSLHKLMDNTNDQNGVELIFEEGSQVFCQYKKLLYPAKILKSRIRAEDEQTRYFVHYMGWNKKWDEWVAGDRLLQPVDSDVQQELMFSDGEKVLCDEDDLLYKAIVLKGCQFKGINNHIQSRYLIHYDGWSDALDEWVTQDRLYKLNDRMNKAS